MNDHVSIIGMGLIGGSIGKALKARSKETQIASLTREDEDLQQAVAEGIIDLLFSSWEELIGWSDLIVLATPLSTLPSLAKTIASQCPKEKKLLVIDVGSVKREIVPLFEMLTEGDLEFLSTHPMAGKERWGFSTSDPTLFQGSCWILSPHAKNRVTTVEKIQQWVAQFGASSLLLSGEKHDEQTALISHLPALLSHLLFRFVKTVDPEALKLAGPGFHSMTRLAKDNLEMQKEIFSLNQEHLMRHLDKWIAFVAEEGK